MTDAAIITLPTKSHRVKAKPVKSTKPNAALERRYAWQRGFAMLLGAVFMVGLILSLSDQADGAAHIMHCDALKAWALAIVIDAGYIGTEFGSIFAATEIVRRDFMKVGKFIILGNVAASMAMNSVAFAAHATTNIETAVAILAGCALPLFLFGVAKGFAILYIRSAR